MHGREPSCLLYVDPPYLWPTRMSRGYVKEFGSESDHERLLALLMGCAATVVLSGYASPLYDTALHQRSRYTMPTIVQNGSARVEVVWVNRPPEHTTPVLS